MVACEWGGRLRKMPHESATQASLHPLIIPYKSPLAKLICSFFHSEAHVGVEWAVALIRKKYWITRIRPVVKQVVRECVRCKRLYAPTCVQKMSDLPSSRLEPYSPPFTTSGVDCFGPFTVKRARSEVKRYGCLFVCFFTRAVHLELLDDLSTSSFTNALRRFVAW